MKITRRQLRQIIKEAAFEGHPDVKLLERPTQSFTAASMGKEMKTFATSRSLGDRQFAGQVASGLTAGSAMAAGATAAAVLALFGGAAFATFYPIAQMQKIEGLITKMAQLNGRPVQLADLDGQTQGRLKEYLATMIIAMNDKESPSEEARESFNELMAKDALPGRKLSGNLPDIPAHAIIDYKTVESLKPYIRELQKKGKEEAAKMKEEPGVA